MPIQYPQGILKSHLHTRKNAGLFDVSHMLGVTLHGADRVAFMEKLCTADLQSLPEGMGGLTVLTNQGGGIIDDCIVTNAGDHLYMVINAGHEDKDIPHMKEHLADFVGKGGDVSLEMLPENSILALQGPKAASVLQSLAPKEELNKMAFMAARLMEVAGLECMVSRSGYTGEDGFEIAIPPGSGAQHNVVALWETLMGKEEVMPVGLGARDSLRLEAGLCLYGNDLDDSTSPVEGSLLWVIAKRRRSEKGTFLGSERILNELQNKSAARKRAGFVVSSGAPVREGVALFANGEEVGITTSGGFSPCLKRGIGMCYVTPGMNKPGTELQAKVRGKTQIVTVTKMPFVPQNYYRGV